MSKRGYDMLLPKKRDAFTAIKRFMTMSDITLKVEEEAILKRWEFCDALLRSKEYDEETIIAKIVEMYNVSTFTARNDIGNAQRLFADSRKLNKKYLIHLHLERIDKDIQYVRKKLFAKQKDKEGKEYDPSIDAKELGAYAKLLESYTYTLNSIPEDIQNDKQPPPIFQFLLAPGQVIDRPMEIDEAIAGADAFLLSKNDDGVYEIPDDEED